MMQANGQWETDRQMSGQGRRRGGGRIDVRRAAGRGAGCSNRRIAINRDYTVRGKCRTQQMLVCVCVCLL